MLKMDQATRARGEARVRALRPGVCDSRARGWTGVSCPIRRPEGRASAMKTATACLGWSLVEIYRLTDARPGDGTLETLIARGLVYECGRHPGRYLLTSKGRRTVRLLFGRRTGGSRRCTR